MTIERKHMWIQTAAIVIPLLLALIGLAIAQEHRTTVIEETTQDNSQQIRLLTKNQAALMENHAKLTAIVEMICKRHDIEDQKK